MTITRGTSLACKVEHSKRTGPGISKFTLGENKICWESKKISTLIVLMI